MREGTQFYRCLVCGKVVSPFDIKEGIGCSLCGNRKIRPTSLRLWEKMVQLVKHPSLLKRDEHV